MYPKKNRTGKSSFIDLVDLEIDSEEINEEEEDVLNPEEAGFLKGLNENEG